MFQERANNFLSTEECSGMKRGISISIDCVNICTPLKEELNDVVMTSHCCFAEWRSSCSRITGIDICACIKKKLNVLEISFDCRLGKCNSSIGMWPGKLQEELRCGFFVLRHMENEIIAEKSTLVLQLDEMHAIWWQFIEMDCDTILTKNYFVTDLREYTHCWRIKGRKMSVHNLLEKSNH